MTRHPEAEEEEEFSGPELLPPFARYVFFFGFLLLIISLAFNVLLLTAHFPSTTCPPVPSAR